MLNVDEAVVLQRSKRRGPPQTAALKKVYN
jgi:hypothetical protein